jgi:hypothetical protein
VKEVLEDSDALVYDNEIAEFIKTNLSIPERIGDMRLKSFVISLRSRNGIIEESIPVIQDVISRVFFWILINEGFFTYNPIEMTLRNLMAKGYYVKGKSFMKETLYRYLFGSNAMRSTYQRLHENLKRNISQSVGNIGAPDTKGILSTWMTSLHINVLAVALDEWAPSKTLRIQQMESQDDSFAPQSILELIMRSLKLCADLEFEDNFISSTTPALEAFILGLLYELFKRKDAKNSLRSLGKSTASVGKVAYIYLVHNLNF